MVSTQDGNAWLLHAIGPILVRAGASLFLFSSVPLSKRRSPPSDTTLLRRGDLGAAVDPSQHRPLAAYPYPYEDAASFFPHCANFSVFKSRSLSPGIYTLGIYIYIYISRYVHRAVLPGISRYRAAIYRERCLPVFIERPLSISGRSIAL